MKTITLFLIICLNFFITISYAQWETVGTEGFSAGTASLVSYAPVSSSLMYVAFTDGANSNKVTVMKFNNINWVVVGTAGFSAGTVGSLSMAVKLGTPTVAYTDASNSNKATVKTFDGVNWVNVGTAGFSSGSATDIDIKFDDSGFPNVSFTDGANANKATVMKFDGTNWVIVGSAGFSSGIAGEVSLAQYNASNLYVAYIDVLNSNKATVKKFDGANWVTVGTEGFSSDFISNLSLSIATDYTIYLAYKDAGFSNKATVKKFNGTAWVTVGTEGFSASTVGSISLTTSSTVPYLAYADASVGYKATVKKFDGSNWVTVDTVGFSSGGASYLSLVANGSILYLAYQDAANANKATVKKFVSCSTFNITLHPINSTICAGGNSSFTISANATDVTYQWQKNNGSGWVDLTNVAPYSGVNSVTLLITNASAGITGTQYKCVVSKYCMPTMPTTTTNPATITINTAPFFFQHPGYSSVCSGTNTTFMVQTTGTNVTYQWQYDNGSGWTNLTNAAPYSNVTTQILTLTNVTLGMNNLLFRCVASGTCTPSANSNSAMLNVKSLPTITSQPMNSTSCVGGNNTFNVNATGLGITYQWQYNNGSGWNNLTETAPYSGVTTWVLNITNTPANLNTYLYRCMVSGTCTPSVLSNQVLLTVNTAPAFTTLPHDTAVCQFSNASFSVSASGASFQYYWQKYNGSIWTNLTDIAPYSNTSTATLSITNANDSLNGTLYRSVLFGCSQTATSNQVMLTINTGPVFINNPNDTIICEGNNATFSVTTNGSGLLYQWQVNDGTGWINLLNIIPYNNTTTSVLSVVSASSNLNGNLYRCNVNGICPSAITSNQVTLTVYISPIITIEPLPVTICEFSNTSFSVEALGTNLTYQWQLNNGSGWSDIIDTLPFSNASTQTLQITGATIGLNGWLFQCEVSGFCPPSKITDSKTLTINPYPNPSILDNSNMIDTMNILNILGCGLTTEAITVQNYISNNSYNWYKIILLDSIQFATGSTLNINLPNSNQIEGKYFLKTTHTNGCHILSKLIKITAFKVPSPVSVSMPPYICKGDILELTATNNENQNYRYKWFDASLELGDNDTLIVPNYMDAFNLNIKAVHDTIVYDHQSSCESDFQTVALINPDNVIIPIVLPNNLYCKNSTVNLSPVNNPPNNTVQWIENTVLINSGPYFTINSLTFDRTIILNNLNNHNCVSEDTIITINVDSIKAGFTVSDSIIILNDVVSFYNHSINGSTYSWNFGDSQTSTVTNPSHYYYSINNFTVSLVATSQIGCKDTIIKHDFIRVTGIEDNLYASNILIYPNPVKDYIIIENQNPNKKELSVYLYNMLGEILENKKATGDKTYIDIGNYPIGIYLLKVSGRTIKINKY